MNTFASRFSGGATPIFAASFSIFIGATPQFNSRRTAAIHGVATSANDDATDMTSDELAPYLAAVASAAKA